MLQEDCPECETRNVHMGAGYSSYSKTLTNVVDGKQKPEFCQTCLQRRMDAVDGWPEGCTRCGQIATVSYSTKSGALLDYYCNNCHRSNPKDYIIESVTCWKTEKAKRGMEAILRTRKGHWIKLQADYERRVLFDTTWDHDRGDFSFMYEYFQNPHARRRG